MVFREIVAGSSPDINKEKYVDKHCEKVIKVLNDWEQSISSFEQSIALFESSRDTWINEMGNSRDSIKDSKPFTELLLNQTRDYNTAQATTTPLPTQATTTPLPTGKVVKVGLDRYGRRFGFIERNPHDIFFHADNSETLDFRGLVGETVQYDIETNKTRNDEVAVNVQRVDG